MLWERVAGGFSMKINRSDWVIIGTEVLMAARRNKLIRFEKLRAYYVKHKESSDMGADSWWSPETTGDLPPPSSGWLNCKSSIVLWALDWAAIWLGFGRHQVSKIIADPCQSKATTKLSNERAEITVVLTPGFQRWTHWGTRTLRKSRGWSCPAFGFHTCVCLGPGCIP